METQHGMFWYLSVVTFQGDDAVEMFFIKSGECRVCFPCWQIHVLAEFLFRKVEGRNNITAVKTQELHFHACHDLLCRLSWRFKVERIHPNYPEHHLSLASTGMCHVSLYPCQLLPEFDKLWICLWNHCTHTDSQIAFHSSWLHFVEINCTVILLDC